MPTVISGATVARRASAWAAVAGLALLSACTPAETASPSGLSSPGATASGVSEQPPLSFRLDVPPGPVAVDEIPRLIVKNGALTSVAVTAADGTNVRGRLSPDRGRWKATDRLEPGQRYRVRVAAVDLDGDVQKFQRSFRTQDLTLAQQTYPSIAPLEGETVGVGMPVIVKFDVAVTDRASIERHLKVESSPRQAGAWRWISGHEVHWRPKQYWKAGTAVTVTADINSVDAGDGIYGQLSRVSHFMVGDAVVMKVDVAAHHMKVFRNGALLRTLPVSAGKSGFTTRSGIKVIIEKFRHKRMDAATTGISEDSPEYYDIEDVEYAQRVTYSGEFLHAAPWSVSSQGEANVSHGCVGMSTADAAWLYGITRRGDVVDTTGSDRPMTLTNGFGDWNLSFREYRAGSAL